MNAANFFGLAGSDLIGLLGAISLIAGGAILIASTAPLEAERLAKRVNLVAPQPLPAAASAPESRQPIVQQLSSTAVGLTEAEQRQIVDVFSKIGVSPTLAVPCFFAVRFVVAIALGALAMIAAGRSVALAAGPAQLATAVGGAIAGWIIPILIIAYGVKRRTSAIAAGLPDALELLVVCIEAGLSLEDGLQRVTHELKDSHQALADELALTWAEINILPSRTQALANLAHRVDVPNVRSVVSILTQSLQLGTPLAQSLRTGATEMRNDQMAALEERASRLPALLTIPVMLFIMPTIFLIIGGPAALRLIDIFRTSMH